MTITPRFLDDLRARLTLSELIGRRIKITRAGREFKACCPFHKEKTPSFYINDDKQFFHCFGCGAHGDAVGFVMRDQNLSFPEAVEALAAQAGLKVPDQRPEDIEKAKQEKSLYALMEVAAAFFETELAEKSNREIMDYLTGRGLSAETIAGFRLGFAPADDQKLRKALRLQGFTDEQMTTMGLIKVREKGGEPYAFFRDRVMFPVSNRAGRVIAFGGRVLPDHLRPPRDSNFKPPKYINSPETPLFYKGQTVYAQAQARAAAGEGQSIVVVEGYMDVIALHQVGFRGGVAPLGTALTEDQITLLWRMISGTEKIITLCFDGDDAGRRAAQRASDRILPLLKPDHSARIAFLPDGEDPDTLVLKKGVGAFRSVLEAGISLADYIWKLHAGARTLDRPEDRAGLQAELETLCERITDPKTKYHYQQFFKGRMSETFRDTRPDSMRGLKFDKNINRFVPSIKVTRKPQTSYMRLYDILLATILNHPGIFDQVDESFGSLHIPDPERDALRQIVMNVLSDRAPEYLVIYIRKNYPEYSDLIDIILCDAVYVHARFARIDAEFDQAVQGFREVTDNLAKRRAS